MGLKSFFSKLWRGTKKVMDNPTTRALLHIGSLAMPQLQLRKFLKVYVLARRAEQTITGPGRGPEKYLEVWNQLQPYTDEFTPKEIKRFIELAVMVLDGTLNVVNADTGAVVYNFQRLEPIEPLDN